MEFGCKNLRTSSELKSTIGKVPKYCKKEYNITTYNYDDYKPVIPTFTVDEFQ